ncbi:MAG: DnaJ domain-containing protein [Bryobacteraceae bacterium]
MSEHAFPLQWPLGWPRVNYRRDGLFKPKSIEQSRVELLGELRMMRAQNPVLSSNLVLRKDGFPHSGQPRPQDPGVAVYFTLGKKRVVLACDKWHRVEHNIWAIARHVSALRGQERWGVGSIEQAFAGYVALEERTGPSCWEILDVSADATEQQILDAYRRKAKEAHPDAGGSSEAFGLVAQAKDVALQTRRSAA